MPLTIAGPADAGRFAGASYDYLRDHPELARLTLWEGLASADRIADETSRQHRTSRACSPPATAARRAPTRAAPPSSALRFSSPRRTVKRGRPQCRVTDPRSAESSGRLDVLCERRLARVVHVHRGHTEGMETIAVDGRRIAFERAGEGPPIVLLHGYVGDGPATWRGQLDRLSDAYAVVAWDAPGAGGSDDPPSETIGMAGYADCLAAFVERLHLDSPHVVGLSFGGALALELVRRHPAVARSLTLVSAYAGWAGSLTSEEVERRLRQALDLADYPPDRLVDAVLPTMFSPATPATATAAFATSLRAFHPAGLRAMARAAAEDLRDALPRVQVPACVVHGALDVRAPRAVAEDLHGGIPGSDLVVIERAGHLCNIEAPERFDATLRAFLARA